MIFSCTQMTMLAVISFFTAMLAPGVQGTSGTLPYAMTNIYFIAYSFLLFNIITFFVASLRLRKIANIFGILLFGHIVVFLMLTLGGFVQSHSGQYMSSLSWGWFFMAVGCVALLYAIRGNKSHPSKGIEGMFDVIIGIIGLFVLAIISGLIIYVSQINAYKKTHIIEGVFGSSTIETSSGITLSPAFESIHNFEFIRSDDSLHLIAQTATGYIQYPEKIILDSIPAKTFATEKAIYTIQSGSLITPENTILGIIKSQNDSTLLISNPQKTMLLVHSGAEYAIDADATNIRNIQENNGDVYWITHTGSGDILYKNNTILFSEFFHIKEYIPNTEGGILLAKKTSENPYEIYKNTTKIFTESGFVVESFRSDGENVWYTIKNNDNTYSIFFNNEPLSKSYDEIQSVFLQKSDNGYVFFARRPGEQNICIITRYQGEKCGFEKILSPQIEADGNGVIFLGREDDSWKIYRNTREIISEKSLPYTAENRLLFFFDTTHPEYFAIIKKDENGYQINKRGKILPQVWKNIGSKPFFGYDGKILIEIEDENGWRIAEL